jgi:NAD(P)-dependent dehydrogenase (short-subunit alcohol dehydrogenase family)
VAVKVAVPMMKKGRVVLITSHAGFHRWPMQSSYSASKCAVNKLAENVGREMIYVQNPCKIFAFHPGFLDIGFAEYNTPAKIKEMTDNPETAIVGKFIAEKTRNPVSGKRAAHAVAILAEGDFDNRSGAYLTIDDVLPLVPSKL